MTDKQEVNLGKSVKNAIWYMPNINSELERQISLHHSLPIEIASFLSAKNIQVNEVENFLTPTLRNEMIDPLLFKDMDKMVSFLADSIIDKKTFGIFGDYDVDGATSIAIMVKYFNALGIESVYYVPNRERDGYGVNTNGIETLISQGSDVIICVDCGTSSVDVINQAIQNNIDVAVIDHHISDFQLPSAVALVNPNRFDDETAMSNICAVAVCFFVLTGLNRELRQRGFFTGDIIEPELLNFLDLVALGTICDVMPLTGINRAFVSQGLKVIHKRINSGLARLSDESGIKQKAKSSHLGFALGPRLNAGGRMGRPELATQILLLNDPVKISELVDIANKINKTRQDEQQEILTEIYSKIDNFVRNNFVFAVGNNWNAGIVGICASRLKEQYNKPIFVVTIKDGVCKGSARSINGFDVGSILLKATQLEILTTGGGHKMAGGFSLKPDKINEFIDYLSAEINIEIPKKSFLANKITSISSLTSELCKKMSLLEPYGIGNAEPKFILKDVLITSYKIVGEKHISCYVKDAIGGTGVNVISFNSFDSELGDNLIKMTKNQPVSMLGNIKLDYWNGQEKISFVLQDMAI